MRTSAVVIAGNDVELAIDWFNMAGVAQTPSAVEYQLFDARDGTSLSDAVEVSAPSESMTFWVETSGIPASGFRRRDVAIQITGTFASDTHTEIVYVTVQKRYS